MKKLISLLLIIAVMSLCACGSEKTVVSLEAMDTVMSLTVYGDEAVCGALKDKIVSLDKALDATDEDSEIYKLNRDKTSTLSDSAAKVLSESLALCEKLDGSFDISIYPAVTAWGFTTGDYRVPDEKELIELSKLIDHNTVTLSGNNAALSDRAQIDLGAVAKGYAADVLLDTLKDSSAKAAVLNLGGTVALYGKKPDGTRFKVGVADPENPASYFGYLSLDKGVIATSGGYERYFEKDGVRYIHILDPKTARPVDNGVLSVTVVSDSGAAADALSTALFVMGLDKAEEYFKANKDFDFIILTKSGDLYITSNIYDDFTLAEEYTSFTLHKL